jgi:hypothetical protein
VTVTVEHIINKLGEFPLDREIAVRVEFLDHPDMALAAQEEQFQYGIGLTAGEGEDGQPVAVFLVEVSNRATS